MKVYIVLEGSYDTMNHGVFSTLARAEEFAEDLRSRTQECDDIAIEEHVIDVPDAPATYIHALVDDDPLYLCHRHACVECKARQ